MDEARRDTPKANTLLLEDNANYLDYRCGYGECTPEWLQKLHNPKCLVICLAIGGLCLGMVVSGLVPISIATLERRFDLTSTQSGVFAAMYKAASLAATIPVAHYGTRGHKGRYLGMAALSLGVGSFICTLPQFLSGPYEFGQQQSDHLCNENKTSLHVTTEKQGSWSNVYYVMLLVGQIFHGLGGAPMSILAVTFIDDNVSQMASPLYTGIYMGFRNIIGPAIGYLGGGLVLKVYGDIGKVDLNQIDLAGPEDSRWYGAWWMGFLVAGSVAITIAFPVLGFAKQLPVAEKHRRKDINQAHQGSKSQTVSFGENLSDLPKSIWVLIRSPTIFALVFQQIPEALLLAGMMTFTPKFVENLFSYSTSTASMIAGGILISGGFLGTMLGGYLIRRLGLRCRGIMLLAIACHSMALPLFFSFLLKCPSAPFVGVTQPYNQTEKLFGVSMENSCNSQCSCSGYYNPICDRNTGINYYSPCFAGCKSEMGSSMRRNHNYYNCSCTTDPSSSTELSSGLCSDYCPLLPAFVILYTILAMSTFAANIPTQQALLRSVQFEQRTLAMGLYVISDGIGVFVGSIAFGRTIDQACVLWKQDKHGGKSACLRYTRGHMAWSIIGFALASKTLVILSLWIAFKFYRKQNSTESQVEPQAEDTH